MQKRKIHKSNQPISIDVVQDTLDDLFTSQFAPTGESISQMMSSVMSNSIELSKLVIDKIGYVIQRSCRMRIYMTYIKNP